MDLHEAIEQISEIRSQIARTETFRGYRSLTVAFSGVVAFAAAGLQALLIPEPMRNVSAYLALWVSVAAVGLVVSAAEIAWRCRRATTGLSTRLAWMAAEQFLPCLLTGALLTFVLSQFAPAVLWMLPGLWSMLFALGIFASARLLPRPIFWVGSFYLIAGACCLAFGRQEDALSPWTMAIPFGVGQLMAAAVLYLKLERGHDEAA